MLKSGFYSSPGRLCVIWPNYCIIQIAYKTHLTMEKKHNLDGEIPANFSGSTWMKDLDDYQLLTEISILLLHSERMTGSTSLVAK